MSKNSKQTRIIALRKEITEQHLSGMKVKCPKAKHGKRFIMQQGKKYPRVQNFRLQPNVG